MLSIRPILLVNGILLSILSVVMLLPAMVDAFVDNPDWKIFVVSSAITAFFGISLYLTNRGYSGSINLRQAFLLTTSIYFINVSFASLPLYLSELGLPFVDAFFETSSGMTSTGSTVLTGLDFMPPGILLWRSLLNAMGGIGIVVLAMAILPMLQIGGMQLFRTESSDKVDKMLPRATQIALVITMIFSSLFLLCAFFYWLAGMSGFDAICHAMATVATGGFSTYDNSFGHFNSLAIEIICIVFMIAGSLPLILYYQVMRGNPVALFANTQVQVFLGIIAGVSFTLVCWLVWQGAYGWLEATRYVVFSVVSIISTAGFATTDWASWGTFSTGILFMLLVVGGCTGSTSGGIKIFRYQVLYDTALSQVKQLIQPHGIFLPRFNGKPIPDPVSSSVMSFFILFAFCFMVLSIGLSAYGLDFLTSMSAAAQALANVGPGLGPQIGPAGSFQDLPDGAKWMLAFAMILGRLELFTVLVLMLPKFWRG